MTLNLTISTPTVNNLTKIKNVKTVPILTNGKKTDTESTPNTDTLTLLNLALKNAPVPDLTLPFYLSF